MRLIMIFLIAIIMIPILVAIGTAIFQWLWNITMPDVFNLKEIRFWQAFRILLLANFLFGAGSFISFSMGIGG